MYIAKGIFSALTPLIGHQKDIQTVKNTFADWRDTFWKANYPC